MRPGMATFLRGKEQPHKRACWPPLSDRLPTGLQMTTTVVRRPAMVAVLSAAAGSGIGEPMLAQVRAWAPAACLDDRQCVNAARLGVCTVQ